MIFSRAVCARRVRRVVRAVWCAACVAAKMLRRRCAKMRRAMMLIDDYDVRRLMMSHWHCRLGVNTHLLHHPFLSSAQSPAH